MTKFVIVQSGDQVEPQPETATSVAIPPGNDPKDFQMPNYVFNRDPLARQLAVLSPLLRTQLFPARLLPRRLRVFVFVVQALIPRIGKYTSFFGDRKSALLEQLEIARFPARLLCANDAGRLLVNHDLRFDCVPLAFSAVISALFFFGRSISVSVASTITNSKRFSLACSRFLPGGFNSRQFLSKFSILTIVRETAASDNRQRCAK